MEHLQIIFDIIDGEEFKKASTKVIINGDETQAEVYEYDPYMGCSFSYGIERHIDNGVVMGKSFDIKFKGVSRTDYIRIGKSDEVIV